MEPIKVGKYNDVIYWNEYNGVYNLTLGWINKDGEPKPTFCTRTLGKEKKETRMAVSIPMGSKEEAIGNLLTLLYGLGYDATKQNHDEDVPF